MELKEALSQIRQVSSTLEAFRTVDDLLSLVVTSQESIGELTGKLEGLRNENADLVLLREERSRLVEELRVLRKEKGIVSKELNDLKSELAALKAQILA
jgi:uncharacterized coiled-coil DUF342 family protein